MLSTLCVIRFLRSGYWEISFGLRESELLDTVFVGINLKIRQPIEPRRISMTTMVLSAFKEGMRLYLITDVPNRNSTCKSKQMWTRYVSSSHPKHSSPLLRPARATPSAPPQIPCFRSMSFPCQNRAFSRERL